MNAINFSFVDAVNHGSYLFFIEATDSGLKSPLSARTALKIDNEEWNDCSDAREGGGGKAGVKKEFCTAEPGMPWLTKSGRRR